MFPSKRSRNRVCLKAAADNSIFTGDFFFLFKEGEGKLDDGNFCRRRKKNPGNLNFLPRWFFTCWLAKKSPGNGDVRSISSQLKHECEMTKQFAGSISNLSERDGGGEGKRVFDRQQLITKALWIYVYFNLLNSTSSIELYWDIVQSIRSPPSVCSALLLPTYRVPCLL